MKRRTVHDAEERLYRDLKWAGVEWDEGESFDSDSLPFPYSF
jgi:glutamyl-tRNA synthetase